MWGPAHVGLGPYVARRVSADTPFDDELEPVDVGVLVGAGAAFPLGPGSLTLDARYEHGLTTLEDGVDAHNRTLVIAVGYATR